MAGSIPDWLRSLAEPQTQTDTPWSQDTSFVPQTTGWERGPSGGLIPVQPKKWTTFEPVNTNTSSLGGMGARVKQLVAAGISEDIAWEIAYEENAQAPGSTGGSGTASAQISADAQRDVARMEVDEARYEADVSYRAAVDVVTRQVDADKYTADANYRSAVDTAVINAQASKDIAAGQVDLGKYQADATYRQAVDVAQIQSYSDRAIAQGQLGLGYYQTLAEMQKNPADWVSYWYATQGEKLPEGYQGAGIPEGLQLPAWLQSLNQEAGYTPTTWTPPVGSAVAQPSLLGPPSGGAPTPGGAAGIGGGTAAGIGGTGGTWLQNLLKNIPSGGTTVSGAWAQEAIKAAAAAGLRVVDAGQGTYQIYRQDDPIGVQQEARYAPGGVGAAANDYMTGAGRTFSPQEQSDIYNFYAAPKETQTALANATPENMARLAATSRYSSSTAGEKEALAKATPEQLARLWAGGQTPSMSGGGRMTIREPAGIIGLHSGRFYATLAEEAPEEVNIKSQKKTAQEQGTGATGGAPRSFAAGGDVTADYEEAAAGPTMPPWLKTLSYGGRQQYPAANLAGLPPAPSAQYMRGMSDSQFQGLQGVVQKAGGYIPDWLKMIAWLMPQGAQFARPSSMPRKY